MAKQVINYSQKDYFLFEGFYETILVDWDSVEEAERQYAEEQGRKIGYIIKWDEYKKRLGDYIFSKLKEYVKDDEIFGEFKFKEIWSPQYYNYDTDHLDGEIEVDIDALASRIKADKKALEGFDKYLHEHYSDRSGFVSFIPNNANDLFERLKFKKDSRESDVLLDYWFIVQIWRDKYSDDCWDVVSLCGDRNDQDWYHSDLYEKCNDFMYESLEETDDYENADFICEP